jgi:hypothetical protein
MFDELWPPESPEVVRDQEQASRKKRESTAASKRLADRAKSEAEHAKRLEREGQFGAQLDRLPRAEIRKITMATWPDIADFELGRLPSKGPPGPGVLRNLLLEHLESLAEIT